MGVDTGALRAAAERLAAAERIVALTGAGISAESGIATFRDVGGLWDRFDPEEVATAGGWLGFLIGRPWEGVEFLRALRDAFAHAAPNEAHRALAELETAGRLHGIVTQNVDGLHREAGSREVVELHGTFARRRCLGCGRVEEVGREGFCEEIDTMIAKLGSYMVHHPAHLLRRCDCGELCRADVVMFGEPVQGLREAMDLAEGCDAMLVCGTSALVHPAAELPERARERGAFLVEVNPSRTELSGDVDVRLEGPAGEVLPALARAVRRVEASV